jgi:hypothetical protein
MSTFLSILVLEYENSSQHREVIRYKKSHNRISNRIEKDNILKPVIQQLDTLRKLGASFLDGRHFFYVIYKYMGSTILYIEVNGKLSSLKVRANSLSEPVHQLYLYPRPGTPQTLESRRYHSTEDLLLELARQLAPNLGSLGALDLSQYSPKARDIIGL